MNVLFTFQEGDTDLQYGHRADIFSFGKLALELLAGKIVKNHIFKGDPEIDRITYQQICQKKEGHPKIIHFYKEVDEMLAKISNTQIQEIVESCLKFDYKERPQKDELLQRLGI